MRLHFLTLQADKRRHSASHGHGGDKDAKARNVKDEKDHHCGRDGEHHVPAKEARLPRSLAGGKRFRLPSVSQGVVRFRSWPEHERVKSAVPVPPTSCSAWSELPQSP